MKLILGITVGAALTMAVATPVEAPPAESLKLLSVPKYTETLRSVCFNPDRRIMSPETIDCDEYEIIDLNLPKKTEIV